MYSGAAAQAPAKLRAAAENILDSGAVGTSGNLFGSCDRFSFADAIGQKIPQARSGFRVDRPGLQAGAAGIHFPDGYGKKMIEA
jgi:hypothetical protein